MMPGKVSLPKRVGGRKLRGGRSLVILPAIIEEPVSNPALVVQRNETFIVYLHMYAFIKTIAAMYMRGIVVRPLYGTRYLR